MSIVYNVVPEKIHTHPMEGPWKFPGGGGISRAKFLKGMYENKLEFPGGRCSAKQKTFCGGSMDIFWNCTFHRQAKRNKNIMFE